MLVRIECHEDQGDAHATNYECPYSTQDTMNTRLQPVHKTCHSYRVLSDCRIRVPYTARQDRVYQTSATLNSSSRSYSGRRQSHTAIFSLRNEIVSRGAWSWSLYSTSFGYLDAGITMQRVVLACLGESKRAIASSFPLSVQFSPQQATTSWQRIAEGDAPCTHDREDSPVLA
jgi:hypothetical protein